MPVFAIIAPAADARLDAAVRAHFPGNYFVITSGQYLVVDDKATTSEITERLEVPGGKVGRALVIPVQNYSGWHAKDLWEWLAARSGGAAPSEPAVKNG